MADVDVRLEREAHALLGELRCHGVVIPFADAYDAVVQELIEESWDAPPTAQKVDR